MTAVLSKMERLAPVAPIFGEGIAYVARTDFSQTSMLGFTGFELDAVTDSFLGLINGSSSVRHVAGVTDEVLTILESAGIHVDEDIRRYSTIEEASHHARALVYEGKRLGYPYPLPLDDQIEQALLVSRKLWSRLNDKANLEDIVPKENLPIRQIVSASHVDPNFEYPVYLKSATDEATGAGFAIRYCPDRDALEDALANFKSLGWTDNIIIENDMQVTSCWCVSLAFDESSVRYIGAAEQVFDAPGHQIGSMIDPTNMFPPEGIQLAIQVGKAAHALGFRGAGGMDIGQSADGKLIVFDPNFRVQGSTTMSMLYQPTAQRSGLQACRYGKYMSTRTIQQLKGDIRGPIADGWFVPVRIIDGAYHPESPANTFTTSLVFGKDKKDIEERHAQMKKLLGTS